MLDIVQNAFESGAAHVALSVDEDGGKVAVTVRDDGCGMDAEARRRALDPFWTGGGKHPGRRVGLGLPFLKMTTDLCGGAFSLESAPGQGTTVAFALDLSSVDTPPMGDLPGLLTGLMNYPGPHDLAVHRSRGGASYDVTRRELAEALGDLSSAGSLALLKDFFSSNEEELAQPHR